MSHVISAWSATSSVHAQSRHQCMIATWSVHAQSHICTWSATWSVPAESRDQGPQRVRHDWATDLIWSYQWSSFVLGTYYLRGFPGASGGKASACNARDPAPIPGSGRSPGEGNGNPLQYSCLENSIDGGAWWATVHAIPKSRTRLSDITFTFHFHALEKEMATYFSVLAWRMPGTAEPGGLPSMGSHRVRYDWSDLAAAGAACWQTNDYN